MDQKTEEYYALALRGWRIYHAAYATSIDKYNKLLQEKKELGISPLYAIAKARLREFPEIPFLMIKTEDEANVFLAKCSKSQLAGIVHSIDLLEINYTYKTIQTFIMDSEMQIRIKKSGVKKNNLWPSADKQTGRSFRAHGKAAPKELSNH